MNSTITNRDILKLRYLKDMLNRHVFGSRLNIKQGRGKRILKRWLTKYNREALKLLARSKSRIDARICTCKKHEHTA